MESQQTGSESGGRILVNGREADGSTIEMTQKPYFLDSYEYEKLSSTDWGKFTDYFCGAFIGFILNVIAKLVGSSISEDIHTEQWEFYALGISGVITLISWTVHKFVRTERKSLVEHIDKHFTTQREQKRARG